MQRDLVGSRRRGRRRFRHRPKERADLRLHRHRVDVSHDDERHAVGTVPACVKCAERCEREALEDVRLADRQPLGVLRSVVEHRDLLIAKARGGPEPAPPLLDHDSPLLLDLLRIEGEAAADIRQRLQSSGDEPLLVGRHLEHVDGLVERRIRVDVRAHARTGRLERLDQLPRLEMAAAVERHVLEKMRESLLLVGFVDRARLHRELEHHALLRPHVLSDVVREPVRQRPFRNRRIERQRIGRRKCGCLRRHLGHQTVLVSRERQK